MGNLRKSPFFYSETLAQFYSETELKKCSFQALGGSLYVRLQAWPCSRDRKSFSPASYNAIETDTSLQLHISARLLGQVDHSHTMAFMLSGIGL